MSSVVLHLFDPEGRAEPASPRERIHRLTLSEVSTGTLLSLVSGSGAEPDVEFLALAAADCRPGDGMLAAAVEQFARGPASVGILTGGPRADLHRIWNRFPAPLAGLIASPELSGTMLLRRATLAGWLDRQPANGLRADEPLRAFVIRAAWSSPEAVGPLMPESGTTETVRPGAGPLSVPPPAPAGAVLPSLTPSPPRSEWLKTLLSELPLSARCDRRADQAEITALHAGLWQIHDFLDESHARSQSIEGAGADRNGDYWHGIMHRREPDYDNAKYWFRRVGQHPCFTPLAALANDVFTAAASGPDAPVLTGWQRRLTGSGGWDPFAFVDLCQQAVREQGGRSGAMLRSIAERLQWAEMLLLLNHCWQAVAPRGG